MQGKNHHQQQTQSSTEQKSCLFYSLKLLSTHPSAFHSKHCCFFSEDSLILQSSGRKLVCLFDGVPKMEKRENLSNCQPGNFLFVCFLKKEICQPSQEISSKLQTVSLYNPSLFLFFSESRIFTEGR